MKLSNVLSGIILTLVALVARAESDPVVLKAQIKATQAETREIRQQVKLIKQAQQVPMLVAKLSKAEAAREKAQAALIKAQGGVK